MIYDPVGGPYAEPALRSIAWEGRFLVIGFAAGEIPKIPLNLALLKGCDIVGVFWGAFIEREPKGHQANMAQLVQLGRRGQALGACARRLSAGEDGRRAQGDRGPPGDGQGDFAAVISAAVAVSHRVRALRGPPAKQIQLVTTAGLLCRSRSSQ